MRQLLYTSQATRRFSEADLIDLLDRARAWNVAHGITGILLSAPNGTFVQILEGAPQAVDQTLARIKADPRHEAIQVLIDHRIPERLFADWSMGFSALDGAQADAMGDALPETPVDDDSMAIAAGLAAVEAMRAIYRANAQPRLNRA